MKHINWPTSQNRPASPGVFRPVVFNISEEKDHLALSALLQFETQIELHDAMACQINELIKARNPGVHLSEGLLEKERTLILSGQHEKEYGNWVYYPWAKKLVHLLPEAQFIELRTDRNRNKITRAEQHKLGFAKIGIVGLSVGRAVALTLAQERVCGEIRLADFDHLELSNLNRLRATVFDLEENKTILTARAIAELDPYISVRCFTKGLSAENMDDFFLEGGKLNILIEECDGLDMKIKARVKAKELQIPVVMDTNDRGMLDIERFDLEPNRPILHGKIEGLDISKLSGEMSNEEKIPFVAAILGIDKMSTRLKASLVEVDHSVRSWPQLASSVALGGALCTNVSRRILLGQLKDSGRWYVDLEEFVRNETVVSAKKVKLPGLADISELSVSEMQERASSVHIELEFELSRSESKTLVEAAILAPSGGNSQPWQFLHHRGRLFLFLDRRRAYSTIDPGRRYAYFSLGAAIRNIKLRAASEGIALQHSVSGASTNEPFVIFSKIDKEVSMPYDLSRFIKLRCTDRKKGNAEPLKERDYEQLFSLPDIGSTRVSILRGKERIATIAQHCGRAERIRILNPICHHDTFEREMRWSKSEAMNTGDGVDLRTMELSAGDITGIQVARDPAVVELIRKWDQGSAFKELTEKITQTSSAIAIISVPELDLQSVMRAGEAVQQFWLKCTSLGIAVQPISAPLFMAHHHLFDSAQILSKKEIDLVGENYEGLAGLVPDLNGYYHFFMLRLSYAPEPSVRSYRRAIEDHFTLTPPPHKNEATTEPYHQSV